MKRMKTNNQLIKVFTLLLLLFTICFSTTCTLDGDIVRPSAKGEQGDGITEYGYTLQIVYRPRKISYLCGSEEFAPTGLQVRVVNPPIGYTSDILAYNSIDFKFYLNDKPLESGDTIVGAETKTITVERMGLTASFNIDVNHVSDEEWRTTLLETCFTGEVSNCSGCAAELERIIPTLGHLWSGWYDIATDAFCHTYGNRDCTREGCGITENNVLISVDHDFVGRIDCSKCGNRYKIGDIGPGGGRIFYVADGEYYEVDVFDYYDFETGITVYKKESGYRGGPFTLYMNANDTTGVKAHYLEAAPAGWYGTGSDPYLAWSDYYDVSTGGYFDVSTGTAIGTGLRNTASILNIEANAPAAKACNDYENSGKNDWFLPSQDELNQLYLNQRSVDFYYYKNFWSSSQGDIDFAWIQNFADGNRHSYSKYSYSSVHAVRAF